MRTLNIVLPLVVALCFMTASLLYIVGGKPELSAMGATAAGVWLCASHLARRS